MAVLTASGCVRAPEIEEPEANPLSARSRIFAADGTVLATLFVENRVPVSIGEVPQVLIDAVVATEDQRFFSHQGFDGKAVVRAAARNAAANRTVQGASTITQQYVKNLYFPPGRHRTMQQKIKEAQLAWKLEQRHSKLEILEKYLNTVYLGNGAYGVRTAAEELFSKPVSQLTLSESALLAGLIRSPENDNPRVSPEKALARRNHVLARMASLRMVAHHDAEAAREAPLGLKLPPTRAVLEPHFVEYVKQSILEDPSFGRNQQERAALLYRGGVEIHTSLDLRLQAVARQAITQNLGRPGDPEASLVAVDPKTGKVVAMIGGRDFNASQVNLALGSKGGGSGRQPGSVFKPIVLAAAYEDGFRPDTVYSAKPPTVRVTRNEVWRPQNYEGKGYGPMNLTTATALSVNAVFVRLGMDVGPLRIKVMAERMGITSPLRPHPSIILGTEEVSVLEMASAYATIANYGVHNPPTPIVGVKLPDNREVRPRAQGRRAVDAGVAWMVTDTLTHVITQGTGTKAQLERPAAGKTGTTQEIADAWFVGYTPDLVTAIWVGHPSGRVPMISVRGTRVFGGTFPAAIWKEFMSKALAGTPPASFQLPGSDLITIDIDPYTGALWNPSCRGRQTIQILRQMAPSHACPPRPQKATPTPTPEISPAVEQSPASTGTPGGFALRRPITARSQDQSQRMA
jgi:1A family penicillin-binding protein